MTDVGRMSVGELVGKVLAGEHADVLRQAVVWLAQELMEAEVTVAAGPAMANAARTGSPTVTATGRAAGTPGLGSWSCASPGCGPAATSRAFWSRVGGPSKR
jgi:hypothetical protein